MTVQKIKGVKCFYEPRIFSEKEIAAYVDLTIEKLKPMTLTELYIKLTDDDETVDITYTTEDKFERIRRITGYLTGDLNTWNDAKRSEERERVKHYDKNLCCM